MTTRARTAATAVTTPIGLVIMLVGLTLLGSTAGIIVLASQGMPIPDVLQNIAVGSLTGLVGLLVQVGRTPS